MANFSFDPASADATPLQYGGVVFDGDNGVPGSINLGDLKGNHVVTYLPGGSIIDDFQGVTPEKVEWSGEILGPNCATTLRTMQSYIKDGKPRRLTWWIHAYYGTLESFVPTGRSANRLAYKATVIITSGDSGTLTGLAPSSVLLVPATQSIQLAALPMIKIQAADPSDKATGLAGFVQNLQKSINNVTDTQMAQQVKEALGQAQIYSATLGQLSPAFVPTQQLIAYLGQASDSLNTTAVSNSVEVQGPASLYDVAGQHFDGDVTRAYDIMVLNGVFSPRIPAGTNMTFKLPSI